MSDYGKTKKIDSTPVFVEMAGIVFEYWQQQLGHFRAQLNELRRRRIIDRLKEGYSVERIQQAIRGIKLSPFHMGKNDRNTAYNDIEFICRNGVNLEKFAEMEERWGQNYAQNPINPADPRNQKYSYLFEQ